MHDFNTTLKLRAKEGLRGGREKQPAGRQPPALAGLAQSCSLGSSHHTTMLLHSFLGDR